MELDLIDRQYSDMTTTEPVAETTKRPFTEDEIKHLWALRDKPCLDFTEEPRRMVEFLRVRDL